MESDIIEKELFRLSKDFKNHQQKGISLENLQQYLKREEAAIEFTSFKYHDGIRWTDSIFYIAFILRKDKPEPELVYLFEEKELDAILKQKKNKPEATIDALYSSASLYNLIWKPLENYLDKTQKIYFAASGLLHKLNLAAIAVNENKVLSEFYNLVQLNTTASIREIHNAVVANTDAIMLYGGVNFNADSTEMKSAAKSYQLSAEKSFAFRGFDFGADPLHDLPFSEMEVDNIASEAKKYKYTVSVVKGISANEESVKALTGKKSPAVFHLATHGKFFSDPENTKPGESMAGGKIFAQSDNPLLRSLLMFAGANHIWSGKPLRGVEDGILTAYEISNMYLPNTKLVVLSACETGLGSIQGSEGVYGLQRAFKMAGVQNLVMSLWTSLTMQLLNSWNYFIIISLKINQSMKLSVFPRLPYVINTEHNLTSGLA